MRDVFVECNVGKSGFFCKRGWRHFRGPTDMVFEEACEEFFVVPRRGFSWNVFLELACGFPLDDCEVGTVIQACRHDRGG